MNPIHCGGDEPTWREGARVAGVKFLHIDHNVAIAEVAAPQDAELARLGAQLNAPTSATGSRPRRARPGSRPRTRRPRAPAGATVSTRALAKSSALYDASEWDVVDGVKKGAVNLEKAPAAALPAPMQAMSAPERKAFVEEKAKERAELQEKIRRLGAEREAFVAAEAKKKGDAKGETLDEALVGSARAQAESKAFAF